MAKSRKTKAKAKDFQKVKLKIGKKLPKGQNETNTSFKSAAIQIKAQYKQQQNDLSQPVVTKKKSSMKELLSHCLKCTMNVRKEGISGILELLKSSPAVLMEHLPDVIRTVPRLFLDKEYIIRQKSIQVFKQVLSMLTLKQLTPFLSQLSAAVACSMTHISEPILEDSLMIVDICLNVMHGCPDILKVSTMDLLPCFVKQIAVMGGGKSNNHYTLITNPNSKKSTSTWRLRVLRYLNQILHSLAEDLDGTSQAKYETVEIDLRPGKKMPPTEIFGPSRITLDYLYSRLNPARKLQQEREKLKVFIAEITPLLPQCWVELRPSDFTHGDTVSLESLTLVDTTLSLYQLFRKFTDDATLFEKEIKQFFLPYFPYALQQRKSDKNKFAPLSSDVVNLRMCDLLAQNSEPNKKPDWLPQVMKFLDRRLSANISRQTTSLHSVVRTLLEKWPEESQVVLGKAYQCFSACRNLEDLKQWSAFFKYIVFDCPKITPITEEWLQNFPDLLVELSKESAEIIDCFWYVFSRGINRGLPVVREAIRQNIGKLLLEEDLWKEERNLNVHYQTNTLICDLDYDKSTLQKLRPVLQSNPTLCSNVLEYWDDKRMKAHWLRDTHYVETDEEAKKTSYYISFIFSLLQCRPAENLCYFDAAINNQADNLVHKAVGNNLRGVNLTPEQLQKLHEQFHLILT